MNLFDCCIQFYCNIYLSISGGNSIESCGFAMTTAQWPVFLVLFLNLCSALQNTLDLLLRTDNVNSWDTFKMAYCPLFDGYIKTQDGVDPLYFNMSFYPNFIFLIYLGLVNSCDCKFYLVQRSSFSVFFVVRIGINPWKNP